MRVRILSDRPSFPSLFDSQQNRSNHNPWLLLLFFFLTVVISAKESDLPPDVTSRIVSELTKVINQSFADFDAKLNQRLADSDAKIDQRLAAFDAKLEQRFANLSAYIIHLMQDNQQEVLGLKAINRGLETAVRIQIYPGSLDRNNTFASGNLVSIGNRFYVSTCRHVIAYDAPKDRSLIITDEMSFRYRGPYRAAHRNPDWQ
jgi:hypothetical protein